MQQEYSTVYGLGHPDCLEERLSTRQKYLDL